MTAYLATTRVAVLRNTTVNRFGDEVDDNSGTPVAGYESLPASLIERKRNVQDPATGTWRVVRYFALQLPSNVVLEDTDRLRDLRDGTVYAIDVIKPVARTLAGMSSLRLEASKTTRA